MTAATLDPSISVVQYGPVRAFTFGTHVFERFPLRLVCPRTRVNLLLSAAHCEIGARIRFRPERVGVLVAYLRKKPPEQ